jgi:hypothetical protein
MAHPVFANIKMGKVSDFCEHGDEHSVPREHGEFVKYLG